MGRGTIGLVSDKKAGSLLIRMGMEKHVTTMREERGHFYFYFFLYTM